MKHFRGAMRLKNNLKSTKKGATMQKQSYEQVFEDLKKIDYEVLVKAMFLFCRDDLLELDKDTRDEILGNAYNFYFKCDLGCFVDERLLDELEQIQQSKRKAFYSARWIISYPPSKTKMNSSLIKLYIQRNLGLLSSNLKRKRPAFLLMIA